MKSVLPIKFKFDLKKLCNKYIKCLIDVMPLKIFQIIEKVKNHLTYTFL